MDCTIHLTRHLHGNNGPLRRTSYSSEAFWNFGCPDIFCPKKRIVLHLMLIGRFEFFVAIHHRKFARIYGTCPMAVLIGKFLGPKMKCTSCFFFAADRFCSGIDMYGLLCQNKRRKKCWNQIRQHPTSLTSHSCRPTKTNNIEIQNLRIGRKMWKCFFKVKISVFKVFLSNKFNKNMGYLQVSMLYGFDDQNLRQVAAGDVSAINCKGERFGQASTGVMWKCPNDKTPVPKDHSVDAGAEYVYVMMSCMSCIQASW